MSDVYMDDLLTGADDLESGRKLKEQLVSLLRGAGMKLHKCRDQDPRTLVEATSRLICFQDFSNDFKLGQSHSHKEISNFYNRKDIRSSWTDWTCTEATLANIRNRFWIPSARKVVRKILRTASPVERLVLKVRSN
ncbi:hypothetical protein TNCT_718371 [Trichonephila clavata]|uniref:Uncharacterized protein n=1 Tax=Trichonephila clavata TaxID=2740835 RepID=A0A8X6FGN5_TRICU|nr:hypothetical protein TNCT_718371 [Trichonephila clavata]